jgi:hypothetical protein
VSRRYQGLGVAELGNAESRSLTPAFLYLLSPRKSDYRRLQETIVRVPGAYNVIRVCSYIRPHWGRVAVSCRSARVKASQPTTFFIASTNLTRAIVIPVGKPRQRDGNPFSSRDVLCHTKDEIMVGQVGPLPWTSPSDLLGGAYRCRVILCHSRWLSLIDKIFSPFAILVAHSGPDRGVKHSSLHFWTRIW